MQLHGLSIDLVHLRSESYTSSSRIPTVEIGTPLQDAERRDFTVNALFYNLQTQQVEDFTEQGLRDLQDGVMRTPLDPNVTFLDGALHYRPWHSLAVVLAMCSRYTSMTLQVLGASMQTLSQC